MSGVVVLETERREHSATDVRYMPDQGVNLSERLRLDRLPAHAGSAGDFFVAGGVVFARGSRVGEAKAASNAPSAACKLPVVHWSTWGSRLSGLRARANTYPLQMDAVSPRRCAFQQC
jgi:hypothetical protein